MPSMVGIGMAVAIPLIIVGMAVAMLPWSMPLISVAIGIAVTPAVVG
ncbi:MAG: hypothetical protein OHK0022_15540 [Roseiflexaceae bacterium]